MAPAEAALRGGPILILLPAGAAGQRVVLGLDLVTRMALAAARAGYARLLALSPAATAGFETVGTWREAGACGEDSVLVIASSAVLGETDWLKRLAEWRLEPGTWAAAGDRIAVVSGMGLSKALAALEESGGARTMADVVADLTRHLRPPAAMLPGVDPMAVEGPGDIPAAERRLLRALVKDTDGFMARHVERPISLSISQRLAATSVTPNQMTLISVAVGVAAAAFFLSSAAAWQTLGAALFLAHSILDGCDGELARLKFKESRRGGVLDFWGDNVVHSAVFACMAIGWSAAIGERWPLLLGTTAVIATLGSAGFIYWRVMRPKTGFAPLYTSVSTAPDGRFARLLDALSRRDFIYIVLLLAFFGRADWFLVMTSLGAPVYFAMLVLLAMREPVVEKPEPRAI
jgi:phosphatidylglycerophosphate synthase